MVGFEWVTDPHTKTPAPAIAKWVKEGARVRGMLLSTDGMCENVNKIKPPMCFGREQVDVVVAVLQEVLATLTPELKQQLVQESVEYVTQRRALWAQLEATAAARAAAAAAAAMTGQHMNGQHMNGQHGGIGVVKAVHKGGMKSTASHGSMAASDTDVSEGGDGEGALEELHA